MVLCVNNLSRFPQAVELDLRQWEGAEPIEMTGGSRFPAIGELPYLLTVAGHGFYWLRIPAHQAARRHRAAGQRTVRTQRRGGRTASESEVANAEQAVRDDVAAPADEGGAT